MRFKSVYIALEQDFCVRPKMIGSVAVFYFINGPKSFKSLFMAKVSIYRLKVNTERQLIRTTKFEFAVQQ